MNLRRGVISFAIEGYLTRILIIFRKISFDFEDPWYFSSKEIVLRDSLKACSRI
jgi:hypothetical protein